MKWPPPLFWSGNTHKLHAFEIHPNKYFSLHLLYLGHLVKVKHIFLGKTYISLGIKSGSVSVCCAWNALEEVAANQGDSGSTPGGGLKKFHDSASFVSNIVGEGISGVADTHWPGFYHQRNIYFTAFGESNFVLPGHWSPLALASASRVSLQITTFTFSLSKTAFTLSKSLWHF